MSKRTLRIKWISIGAALALLGGASLVVGLLLQSADNSVGESFVMLAKILAAFSVASFAVLVIALKRWRAPAEGATASRPTSPRRVSKLSRYVRGVFQAVGAFALTIIGLLVLTRGNKSGIVVIAIGIVFAVSSLTNFWLAERTSRAAAIARAEERT